VLAPKLLPALLGPEWKPMVFPFEILVVAGVAQALLAILREFLLGSGNVAFCVRVDGIWLLAMFAGLLLAVRLDGIRGAAITHLVLLVPVAVAYTTAGARRMGSSFGRLCRPLLPLFGAVAIESAFLSITIFVADSAGASDGIARVVGAVAGLLAVGVLLYLLTYRERRLLLPSLRPRGRTA
jgi:O-antigen/teichoic acid export membrane protein